MRGYPHIASAPGDALAPKLDIIDGKVATVAPHIPEGRSTRGRKPMARNPRPHTKEKHDQIVAKEAKRKEIADKNRKRMLESLD